MNGIFVKANITNILPAEISGMFIINDKIAE